MISPTAEYALRAAVYLGSNPKVARTNQQIADATMVPPAYLSKVLQALARAGILSSQRGLGGGYRLNRETNEVSLLTVVNAVDEIDRIRSCPLGLVEESAGLCTLHQQLDQALASFEKFLSDTTVSHMVQQGCNTAEDGTMSCAGPIQLPEAQKPESAPPTTPKSGSSPGSPPPSQQVT